MERCMLYALRYIRVHRFKIPVDQLSISPLSNIESHEVNRELHWAILGPDSHRFPVLKTLGMYIRSPFVRSPECWTSRAGSALLVLSRGRLGWQREGGSCYTPSTHPPEARTSPIHRVVQLAICKKVSVLPLQ